MSSKNNGKKKKGGLSPDIATNKKARRDYAIETKFEAGIELVGTEVKSIRDKKVNIADSFARVEGEQCFLYGIDIQPWQTAGEWFQHAPKRPRRLLLHKKEILQLAVQSQTKGYSIVCTKMYWKGNRVKVEIGLAKGKNQVDQRHDLKERVELMEAKREMARFNKGY